MNGKKFNGLNGHTYVSIGLVAMLLALATLWGDLRARVKALEKDTKYLESVRDTMNQLSSNQRVIFERLQAIQNDHSAINRRIKKEEDG